jgi:hypothetical protein
LTAPELALIAFHRKHDRGQDHAPGSRIIIQSDFGTKSRHGQRIVHLNGTIREQGQTVIEPAAGNAKRAVGEREALAKDRRVALSFVLSAVAS